MKKNVAVDLFSGTGSATKYFRKSDRWKVIDVELNPDDRYNSDRIDYEKDIMDVRTTDLPITTKFIWASPPCDCFSIGGGSYWTKYNESIRMPQRPDCIEAVRYVYKTLYLIDRLSPDYWYIENPRGGMRNVLGQPQEEKRDSFDQKRDTNKPGTITYCQFGDDRMKPTDLWGHHPDNMKYLNCNKQDTCHNNTSRGYNTGTEETTDSVEKYKIPDRLAKHIYKIVDKNIR